MAKSQSNLTEIQIAKRIKNFSKVEVLHSSFGGNRPITSLL